MRRFHVFLDAVRIGRSKASAWKAFEDHWCYLGCFEGRSAEAAVREAMRTWQFNGNTSPDSLPEFREETEAGVEGAADEYVTVGRYYFAVYAE